MRNSIKSYTFAHNDNDISYRTADSAAGHDAWFGFCLSDEGRNVGPSAESAVGLCLRCNGWWRRWVGPFPSLEMEGERANGGWALFPLPFWFWLALCFFLIFSHHPHIFFLVPEGPRSRLSRTVMLALAVTIHNLPEGMAVGVVFAGAEQGAAGLSLASAVAVSLGIAIQNVPEGAIISMPMRAEGNSKWRSFMIGSLSGAVEPVGAIAVLLLASLLMPIMPYMLAFAAGAMFYVVVEELIPEASEGEHSNLSTIGFAIGFVLMMVLDVVMG